MENKTNTHYTQNLTARFKTLLVFLIFLILASVQAQEQWRVLTTSNSQLPSNNVGLIAIDTNNIKWIGTDSGLVKIDGNTWIIYTKNNSPLPSNSAGVRTIDVNNCLWIVAYGWGLVKFDGLSNWTVYDTNNSQLPSNLVLDVDVDLNDVKWICTTNKGLVRFNDSSWTVYDTNNSGLASNITWVIVINNNVKWVGTFARGISRFNDTTWITYNIYNSGLPSDVIKGLTLDHSENLWVATQFGGIAKFNYPLNQWTVYNSTNSGLPSNNTYMILTDRHRKWIGTQAAGLVLFNDTNWFIYNTSNSPLPSNTIVSLGLDSNSNLWISTGGGLVIYNPNGIVSLNNTQTNIPKDIVLYQNYPNPFNPTTKIEFDIPSKANNEKSNVRLIIYNMLGSEIALLLDKQLNAGSYSIEWNGADQPSGVYFYKLEKGNYSQTKKMVLLK